MAAGEARAGGWFLRCLFGAGGGARARERPRMRELRDHREWGGHLVRDAPTCVNGCCIEMFATLDFSNECMLH